MGDRNDDFRLGDVVRGLRHSDVHERGQWFTILGLKVGQSVYQLRLAGSVAAVLTDQEAVRGIPRQIH